MDTSELQRLYGDEILAFIQKCSEKSYANGIDYVQRAKQVEIPLTIEDVNNIEQTTNKVNTDFWQTVSRLKERQRQQEIEREKQKAKTEFNPTVLALMNANALSVTLASRYAADITTGNLARGVVTSARRVAGAPPRLPAPPRRAPVRDRFAGTSLLLGQPAEGELTVTGRVGIETEIIYIFMTEQDERVCPECEPLHGVEMSESMGNLQIPPIHGDCRCRLTFKI